MAEFNIIGKQFDPLVDLKLFYTDEEIANETFDVPLTPIEDSDTTLAHLLVRLGKFKSNGEAKKNGWNRPIPMGWSHFTIGKGSNRDDFWIWNPEQNMTDFAISRRAKANGISEEEYLERLGTSFFTSIEHIVSSIPQE